MKFSKNSIGIKLWKYFVLYAAITLALLWLLQTVFLQGFYSQMQLKSVEQAANDIAENLKSEEDFLLLDSIAYENSFQIILTDWNGNIRYSVDQYSSAYRENQNPYQSGTKQSWQMGLHQSLPEDYDSFLDALSASEDGSVSYELASETDHSNWIYGKALSLTGEQLVLYINAPIGAVYSTVVILRTLLLAVSFLLLCIGFGLAYLFARRFARPIIKLSAQTKKLAEGGNTITFEKGFCTELDALSSTLDETAQSLARLENSRRELLANVTHDLRTPLTLISGYAEKIGDLSWEEREEACQDAAIIKREANRLTLLVNDILDYSVLQSGAASFNLQSVNISRLAEKVILQFQVLHEQKQIIFEQSIEPELYVTADEQRLSQVFYNLIANAITHVGNNRIVGVRVSRKGKTVRVEVYDHGQGISQENIPHIWDRYFTSRERKRSENGTGLGLSIVKEILTAHSAEYGVNSQTGQGSCFWFELFCC